MVRKGRIDDTIAQIRETNWDDAIPLNTRNFMFGNGQRAFDTFYSTIKEAEDKHQPLKMAKIKGDKPLMTPEIKQLIQKRQKLFYLGKPAESAWKKTCAIVKAKCKKRIRAFNHQYTLGNTDWWKEVKQAQNQRANDQIDPELATQINEGFYQVWGWNKAARPNPIHT
jgi:hypothetical protein